jgi:hypothetical protein
MVAELNRRSIGGRDCHFLAVDGKTIASISGYEVPATGHALSDQLHYSVSEIWEVAVRSTYGQQHAIGTDSDAIFVVDASWRALFRKPDVNHRHDRC